MRQDFVNAVLNKANNNRYVFLTGDLGFMALEEIRATFKERFINAGVAEQNMVSVAAGLAKSGFKVFVYSIAPFCYARPFEQIRNDLCLGQLPVCLVGNGGGYGYGHMGPTHHALEDCAAMNALGVKVLVPAFNEDLCTVLSDISQPTYLRLGVDVRPKETIISNYAPWRVVLPGNRGALVALGPLAGLAWQALLNLPIDKRPSVWAVSEFNEAAIPDLFWSSVIDQPLWVIEEHVTNGGLAMHISLTALKQQRRVSQLIHRPALGYPTGKFGSQTFHRFQCGMDIPSIFNMINSMESV